MFISHRFSKLSHIKRPLMFIIHCERPNVKSEPRKSHCMIFKVFICVMLKKITILIEKQKFSLKLCNVTLAVTRGQWFPANHFRTWKCDPFVTMEMRLGSLFCGKIQIRFLLNDLTGGRRFLSKSPQPFFNTVQSS